MEHNENNHETNHKYHSETNHVSHRAHHGRHHRSHRHHRDAELENMLIFPEETSETDKKTTEQETTQEPSPRWRRILWLVLLGLSVAACGFAAWFWLFQGEALADAAALAWFQRLRRFATVALAAAGVALLSSGILSTWRRWIRVVLMVFGGLFLALSITVGTMTIWLTQGVLKDTVAENIQQEEKPDDKDVAVNDKLEYTTEDGDDLVLELPSKDKVHNIALFGIDQDQGSVGRSDALLILSVDKVHNKIKLTSLDRDSLVAIDGHGEEKLTHAWAYGNSRLALKTINQNFGMNITDYAYVNFTEFVSAIDYLGGVRVNVTAAERDHMNRSYSTWFKYYGDSNKRVQGTGNIVLNGAQALAYTRNRSDGTGNRASRHREVLTAMLAKVKDQPLTELNETLGRLLRLCHTSLTPDEIADLVQWTLEEAPETEELSLPTAELKPWGGILDRGTGWVRVYDLKAASVILYNFIYENTAQLPSVDDKKPAESTKEETKDTSTTSATTE